MANRAILAIRALFVGETARFCPETAGYRSAIEWDRSTPAARLASLRVLDRSKAIESQLTVPTHTLWVALSDRAYP